MKTIFFVGLFNIVFGAEGTSGDEDQSKMGAGGSTDPNADFPTETETTADKYNDPKWEEYGFVLNKPIYKS